MIICTMVCTTEGRIESKSKANNYWRQSRATRIDQGYKARMTQRYTTPDTRDRRMDRYLSVLSKCAVQMKLTMKKEYDMATMEWLRGSTGLYRSARFK